jgi:hypothetical protein
MTYDAWKLSSEERTHLQVSGPKNGGVTIGTCLKWSYPDAAGGFMECTSETAENVKVCTKMNVVHVHKMSQYAGILLMKRTRCIKSDGKEKCSVYKAGLCIDVGHAGNKPRVFTAGPDDAMWSHPHNSGHFGRMSAQQLEEDTINFAKKAEDILKYYDNKLPDHHKCSDNRNSDQYGPRKDRELAIHALRLY